MAEALDGTPVSRHSSGVRMSTSTTSPACAFAMGFDRRHRSAAPRCGIAELTQTWHSDSEQQGAKAMRNRCIEVSRKQESVVSVGLERAGCQDPNQLSHVTLSLSRAARAWGRTASRSSRVTVARHGRHRDGTRSSWRCA